MKFRWHRFYKIGGTGFYQQNKDIPVTYPFTFTFHPSSSPRLSTVNSEVKVVIPWRFEDSTVEFKVWGEKQFLQPGGTGFPSVLGLQQCLHHVGRYPNRCSSPIYLSRSCFSNSLGRTSYFHTYKSPFALDWSLLGHIVGVADLGFLCRNRWHRNSKTGDTGICTGSLVLVTTLIRN